MDNNKVEIRDYEKPQHDLKICLELCGLSTNYQTVDLIYYALNLLEEKGDDFSIKDGVKLQVEHDKKWKAYFKALNNKQ